MPNMRITLPTGKWAHKKLAVMVLASDVINIKSRSEVVRVPKHRGLIFDIEVASLDENFPTNQAPISTITIIAAEVTGNDRAVARRNSKKLSFCVSDVIQPKPPAAKFLSYPLQPVIAYYKRLILTNLPKSWQDQWLLMCKMHEIPESEWDNKRKAECHKYMMESREFLRRVTEARISPQKKQTRREQWGLLGLKFGVDPAVLLTETEVVATTRTTGTLSTTPTSTGVGVGVECWYLSEMAPLFTFWHVSAW